MYSLLRVSHFFVFIFLCTSVFAQHTIKGTVKDAETAETMPGVNIYLANTTTGVSSNENGRYQLQLNGIPPGSYELVFSFVGYEKRIFNIKVEDTSFTQTFNPQMQPKTLQADEVQVVGSNKEWKENFKRFREEFIGETPFAKETEIVNKVDVHFKNDPKTGHLLAFADQPLRIENKALGYNIYVELDDFRWSDSGNRGSFKVYPHFKAMSAEQDQWQKNREKVYRGSFRHFMKTLYDDGVLSSGFSIRNPEKIVPLTKEENQFELLGRPGASPELVEVLQGFRIYQELHIEYNGGEGPLSNHRSILKPNAIGSIFFIDNRGILLNPNSLKISGHWSNNRLADQLPFDYK